MTPSLSIMPAKGRFCTPPEGATIKRRSRRLTRESGEKPTCRRSLDVFLQSAMEPPRSLAHPSSRISVLVVELVQSWSFLCLDPIRL